MKKIVLIISMVLCASLFMGCANILEGLTKKEQKLNNVGIPVGEYVCIDATSTDGKRPNIQSSGAFIGTDVIDRRNLNFSDEGLCLYGGGPYLSQRLIFLKNGQIAIIQPGQSESTIKNDISWEYKENALFISYTLFSTTTYKYVLV